MGASAGGIRSRSHARDNFVAALTLSVVVGILTASCSLDGTNSLVGEYAAEQGGAAEVRVTKNQGQLEISMLNGQTWTPAESLIPLAQTDYAELFGSNWQDLQPIGLGIESGLLAIFRVKKGVTLQGHTFTTGYYLFFFLVGSDLYKL